MAECFLVQRGGVPLNFKVVGNPKPDSPKENMLWVDTNTHITGYLFTSNDPNLLDFNLWANNISVDEGTKIVSDGAITLMSTGTDCRTGNSIPIPCKAGKTYIVEWDFSGNGDTLFILPNNGYDGFVSVPSEAKKLEYTASEDATFFALRVDVGNAPGESGTYSNIRIYEKGQEIMPGTVWITTGTSSTISFSATKKNPVMVYPISAKQYVGGKWVDKVAKIYQGGQWKPFWDGTLFYMGNRYEEHTGGWTGRRMSFGETTISATGSYANDKGHGSIYNLKGVDVTKYNTLTVNITTAIISSNEAHFGLSASPGGDFAASAKITATGTMDLDITNLKGEYYFLFKTKDNYTSATTTVEFDTIRLRNR